MFYFYLNASKEDMNKDEIVKVSGVKYDAPDPVEVKGKSYLFNNPFSTHLDIKDNDKENNISASILSEPLRDENGNATGKACFE